MHAFLAFAATVVTLFIALFAGGALIGLASLFTPSLRVLGSRRDVRSQVTVPKPEALKARQPEAGKAETPAGAEPAYAYA